MNGKLIYSAENKNTNQYYIMNKNLSSGIYILKCIVKENNLTSNLTRKIIVQ